jgi:tetratricopeptide (TPR) repeat protein
LERFEEAEEVLRRGLNINFAFAGDSDPDTISSMDNLGDVLEAKGDIIAMSEMRHRQLAALESTEGPDSEEVLRVMQNLAVRLRDAGHLDEAEPIQCEAMRRFIHVYGEGSVEAATTYSATGELLRLKGDLAGAEGFYRRALAIRELELGPAADATDIVRRRLEKLIAIRG